jgi:hypothetical protein
VILFSILCPKRSDALVLEMTQISSIRYTRYPPYSCIIDLAKLEFILSLVGLWKELAHGYNC